MAVLKSYGREVRSVFQLLGDKENDITSSICWALVKCPVFMKGIIKRVCGVDADPEQVTILNLRVVKIDAEKNLIAVKGAIPGAKNGIVFIRNSVKA